MSTILRIIFAIVLLPFIIVRFLLLWLTLTLLDEFPISANFTKVILFLNDFILTTLSFNTIQALREDQQVVSKAKLKKDEHITVNSSTPTIDEPLVQTTNPLNSTNELVKVPFCVYAETKKTTASTHNDNKANEDEEVFSEFIFGVDGYNQDGYNEDGFNRDGLDEDGFDIDGYNKDGFNREGCNYYGDCKQENNDFDADININDSDEDGYDEDGFRTERY